MSYFDDNESELTGLDPLGSLRARRNMTGPANGSLTFDQQPGVPAADRIWTTQEGERIRMGDMTRSHRTNCLRMLIRKHGDVVRTMPTGRALIECGVDD